MWRDLFFEFYRDSWRRRDQLAGEIVFPIGILTALWGILIFFVKSAPWGASSWSWRLGLIASVGVASALFLTTVWHILRAYHGWSYATIPMLRDLIELRRSFLAAAPDVADGERIASQAFEEHMERILAEAADVNMLTNEWRGARLYRMRRSLVLTTLATILAAVPWTGMQIAP